ncbi:MAG: hypothetical protein RXN92_04740 [Thermoplasmatales archaeon]
MRSIIVLALVSFLILGAAIPLSHASTLNATINPKTNMANVTATSNFVAVLTFPSTSFLSNLNGTVITLNGSAVISSTYLSSLSQDVERGDDSNNSSSNNTTGPQLHVVNATLYLYYKFIATNTSITVFRNLTLNMTITNILRNISGHEVISMNWRAFKVEGKLMANINAFMHLKTRNQNFSMKVSESFDVNELGDQLGIGENDLMSGDLMEHIFSNFSHKDTIDFTEFKVPLSQWNRVYNPTLNETIYTLTINKNVWANVTISSGELGNLNLSYHYDPSSSIAVMGNAVVGPNNTLEIVSSTSSANVATTYSIAGIAVIVVVVGIAAAVFYAKRRKK